MLIDMQNLFIGIGTVSIIRDPNELYCDKYRKTCIISGGNL